MRGSRISSWTPKPAFGDSDLVARFESAPTPNSGRGFISFSGWTMGSSVTGDGQQVPRPVSSAVEKSWRYRVEARGDIGEARSSWRRAAGPGPTDKSPDLTDFAPRSGEGA